MTSRRLASRGAAALSAAVCTGLTLATGPAYAENVVLRDPGGDVWRVSFADSAPTRARGADQDLRGGLVRHGPVAVTLRWRYAALRPRGRLVVHRALLRTGEGAVFEARVDAGRGYRDGRSAVFGADDARVDCAPVHRIDSDRRLLTLVIPRSCLGDPATIQARLDAYAGGRDGSFRRDNLHDRSAQTSRWTRPLAAG